MTFSSSTIEDVWGYALGLGELPRPPPRRSHFAEQWHGRPTAFAEATWQYDADHRTVTLLAEQVQPERWGTFTITLPVVFEFASEEDRRLNACVSGKQTTVELTDVSAPPTNVFLDPEGTVLVAVTMVSGR